MEMEEKDQGSAGPAIGVTKSIFRDYAVENRDLWQHRSSGMRCETCMWFVFKELDNDKPKHLGRCRKHAPSMHGFVPVFGTDWCGDHRLNENAV